ncbi:MAG: ABC transporter substrate-binding protein [Elsteraceae bacterium]
MTMINRRVWIAGAALAVLLSSAPAMAQGQLNMICAPASDWCEAIVAGYLRDTGVKVNMVRKSAGEILAQVRAEKENPKLDIWFGASTDTHFVAAEEGLLQPYTSPNMPQLLPWAIKAHQQSGGRCVGVSSGAIGIVYNAEWLKKKNLPVPLTWQDLLKPDYKGDVQMPNPNSSGTAYTIIAGLVQLWGEDRTFDYLKRLHPNINAYTRSGSAPINAAARGETGIAISFNMEALTAKYAGFPVELNYPPEGTGFEVACMAIIRGSRNEREARRFYDWYLTPAAMDIGPKANQWHQPAHSGAAPDPKLPDQTKVKLVDYDFAFFGSSATRRRILARWDAEIGSLPR